MVHILNLIKLTDLCLYIILLMKYFELRRPISYSGPRFVLRAQISNYNCKSLQLKARFLLSFSVSNFEPHFQIFVVFRQVTPFLNESSLTLIKE